jgi:hypothetical protein
MKKQFIAFILVFISAACAAQPSSNQDDSFVSAVNKLREKGQAICAMPELAPLFAKTACAPQDISFEQIADSTKVNEEQKIVLMKWIAQTDAVVKQTTELFRSGDDGTKRWADYLESIQPENDKLKLNLYNGKITWGEFNQQRKASFVRSAAYWRQLSQPN